MDLYWPACICIGLGVLEISFLAASDASISGNPTVSFRDYSKFRLIYHSGRDGFYVRKLSNMIESVEREHF